MRLHLLAAGGVIAVTAAKPALAYRPFDGTDADTAEFKEIELEVGPVGYLRQQQASAVIAPNLIFNYGVLPRWELVIQGAGLYGAGNPPSFVDGGVFVKHVLREGVLQGKKGWSLASEVGVLLPLAGVKDTVDDAGVYIGLIASYGWRDFVMHWNLSIARSTDAEPDLYVGVILEGVPKARIRPVAELYVDRHGGGTTPSALIGTIFRVNDHLAIDAATRLAWFMDEPAFEIRAGFTWGFGL